MNPANLFALMLLLYASASVIPVLLYRKQKLGNIAGNIVNMLASATGIITSLYILLGTTQNVLITKITTTIPYISFTIKLDGISAFFILALSILTLFVSLYSIGYTSHYLGKKPVWALNSLNSLFMASMVLVFSAGDTILFFVAWEVMSLVSYFLVAFEHENKESRRASTLYIIMTHVGTAFLMAAFIIMYIKTGSFELSQIAGVEPFVKGLLFVFFLIGFGTKAGMVPLHVWLPYAHPAAPGNVSSLMSGIMIKTAVYGMIRFLFDALCIQSTWMGLVLLTLGLISSVIGVAYAYVDKNVKRLLAYSSIENMGIILMGLGIAAIASASGNKILMMLAITASMLHTFNHMLFKGLMFLNAGSIHFSTHTKNLEELGGLIKKMPFTAVFTLIGALSISAIVPFNGFVGEWLTYQSLFMTITKAHPLTSMLSILSAAALAMAGALAAGSFVKLFGIAFLGVPRSEKAQKAVEVPKTMLASKAVLSLMCLLAGLFPMPLIVMINNAFSPITGTSIYKNLSGFSSFLVVPMTQNKGSIMPAASLAIMAVIIVFILIISRVIGGKTKNRSYGTWDCGFIGLNERMQYSSTGFSNPIGIVLRMLYKPSRELVIDDGETPYHPTGMRYSLSTERIFEKYLYRPIIRHTTNFSRRIKLTVQTGSIHMYLTYIFVLVFILLVYNRLF